MKKSFLLALIFLLSSCGTTSKSEIFGEPILTAVDSVSDRLFVVEKERIFFIYQASTRNEIGDQPVVKKKRLPAIFDALPTSPTNMVVINRGSGVSRIFITGAQEDADGNLVTNQILVLDFDGTTLSEASFSPMTVSDGDGTTNDTDNILGGLVGDDDDDLLYVTDSSAAQLHIYNAADGSEQSVIAVAGTPNKMSLDGNRLYIANSTATAADQVITVLNTDTLATTTIDLDIPTNDIAALSNTNGTVLLAKESDLQKVSVQEVDTTTFASASDIPAGNASTVAGEINVGNGITSSVGGVLLTKNTSGVIYGYAPQSDGTITLMTVQADLSSFTQTGLSTSTRGLTGLSVYFDTGNDTGITVYMAASVSGDLVHTASGSDEVSARF